MKILIVDDEMDVETLFRQKFKKEIKSHELLLEFAFSAENALNKLKEKDEADIVLILSDINMPGMNGIELLKIIKSDMPHLKVYMITAYDDDENSSKAKQYGADNYLTKPIDFNLLKSEISRLKAMEK
jgi:CheY-like chemotaxis protein